MLLPPDVYDICLRPLGQGVACEGTSRGSTRMCNYFDVNIFLSSQKKKRIRELCSNLNCSVFNRNIGVAPFDIHSPGVKRVCRCVDHGLHC